MTAQAWTFRVVWPVEDPELFDHEAIDLARADLPAVAARHQVVVTGSPVFHVQDATSRSWPATNTAVVCVVPAVPAARRLVA